MSNKELKIEGPDLLQDGTLQDGTGVNSNSGNSPRATASFFPIVAVGLFPNYTYFTRELINAYYYLGCNVAEAVIGSSTPYPSPGNDVVYPDNIDNCERNIFLSLASVYNTGVKLLVRLSSSEMTTSPSTWFTRWQSAVHKALFEFNAYIPGTNYRDTIYGWMLYDQPSIKQFPVLLACMSAIRSVEGTNHYPVYIDLYPVYATEAQLFGFGGSDWNQWPLFKIYNEEARRQLNPDVWSNPFYGVEFYQNKLKFKRYYFRNLLYMNVASIMTGKPFWAYIKVNQDNGESPELYSELSIRAQTLTAVACGAKGIVYHGMTGNTPNYPITLNSSGNIVITKSFFGSINGLLMHYALPEGRVYDVRYYNPEQVLGSNTEPDIPIPNESFAYIAPYTERFEVLKSIEPKGSDKDIHILVSLIKEDSKEYIYVVNLSMIKGCTVNLKFDRDVQWLTASGNPTISKNTNQEVMINLSDWQIFKIL